MEWRDIPDLPGYQASSDGQIRSVDRIVRYVHRYGGLQDFKYKGRVLKTVLDKATGYRGLILLKKKKYAVHRLVASVFLSKKPFDEAQINHKNGIKSDNRSCNLEWVSPKENIKHAIDNGLFGPSNRRKRNELQ